MGTPGLQHAPFSEAPLWEHLDCSMLPFSASLAGTCKLQHGLSVPCLFEYTWTAAWSVGSPL